MDRKQRLWTKCSPVCTWWDTLCKVFLLCETTDRLQLSAFFKTQEPETYKEELLTLKRLQDSIAEKDADRSRELLEEFSNTFCKYDQVIPEIKKMKAAS